MGYFIWRQWQCRIFPQKRTLNLHGEQLCYWPWPESWSTLVPKNGRPTRSKFTEQMYQTSWASSFFSKKLINLTQLAFQESKDSKETKEAVPKSSNGLLAAMQADLNFYRMGQSWGFWLVGLMMSPILICFYLFISCFYPLFGFLINFLYKKKITHINSARKLGQNVHL